MPLSAGFGKPSSYGPRRRIERRTGASIDIGRRLRGVDRRDLSRQRPGDGEEIHSRTSTRRSRARSRREPVDINPKGHLQELLQSISPRSPVYELISQSGPEHEKTFVVQAVWEGMVLGRGSGRSKKEAETVAAIEAMELKRWERAKQPEIVREGQMKADPATMRPFVSRFDRSQPEC